MKTKERQPTKADLVGGWGLSLGLVLIGVGVVLQALRLFLVIACK